MNMEKLEITNPRKGWVIEELKKLIDEWENWQVTVSKIQDHPYNKQTQTEVFADGEENMEHHSILQMKTITFLDNNISGHWFINRRDGSGCDRTDLRLHIRVKHRLSDLREIEASLQYALLADSYWKQKAKEVIDKITDKSPEVALGILASYKAIGEAGSDSKTDSSNELIDFYLKNPINEE